MAEVPKPHHTTAHAVAQWWESQQGDGHRAHLGASIIGHECERFLWLTFRWAGANRWPGRILRLFDRGRREEAVVHAELRGIGCEVWADDGTSQYRVSAVGGHFGGSMDGVVAGLPEAPSTPHVLEVKTHSAKSFKDLTAKGVREAQPRHLVQMQAYMHLAELDRALYYAVNKDTDELHIERVERDNVEGARILARAERVIAAAEPAPRISADPAWWQCKSCHFHAQCHGTEAPEVNCRTCAHSTPELDGAARWSCALHGRDLTVDQQRAGCDGHRYIPIMLERIGTQGDVTTEPDGNAAVQYVTPEGSTFVNGASPAFSSYEIRAAKHKQMLADIQVQQIKGAWAGAKVVA
jgi:hypothetical protein